MNRSSKEIWKNINKLFGAHIVNVKFFLKLQLFIFKMLVEAIKSSHVNDLRSIIRQLVEVNEVVDEEDVKAILLNIFSSKYNSAILTLS
jgi:hypothetical protein